MTQAKPVIQDISAADSKTRILKSNFMAIQSRLIALQAIQIMGSVYTPRSPRMDISSSLFQAVDDECAIITRHALVDTTEGWRVII